MRSFEVGQRFIDYYQNYEHQVLPRGSLIDPSVPMTFVGSAGLTQIESAVERGEDRAGERYVLLQTCFRHFDIEKVGRSPIHLSLFDMAGAFSFGQISREDTLNEIWRFLTGELGLQGKQIWATHFGGGKIDGQDFEADSETFRPASGGREVAFLGRSIFVSAAQPRNSSSIAAYNWVADQFANLVANADGSWRLPMSCSFTLRSIKKLGG
jgi:hypothetical protein